MTDLGHGQKEIFKKDVDLELNYLTQAGIFAGIYINDNSTSQSIPTGTTYTKITAFASNESSNVGGLTGDANNDKITISRIGKYRVEGSFSFSAGTANTKWWGAAFLNGVELDNIHFTRKINTANDVGNVGFTGFLETNTVPLDVDLRIRHDNVGSINVTIEYGNLNMQYLGAYN